MNPGGFGRAGSGGFTGEPKIKRPWLPLKAKLSIAGKLRSFIGNGAFSKSGSGGGGNKIKQPNFLKGL